MGCNCKGAKYSKKESYSMPVLTSASTSAASPQGLAQVRPLINTSEAFQRPALGLGKTEFLEARNKSSQSSRSPHSSSSIKGKSLTIGLSGIGGASVARDSSGGLVGGGIKKWKKRK